ncbi:MAG TPA: phosphatidylserine/phosphatidylglycerophosphate/cardiolipin synthase family protein, partial [Haliangium sp.]|nr:phosphatidylserine/phosphatidylglycerophosphate/cardiolipin synthase family protein [Haliangium sp.]
MTRRPKYRLQPAGDDEAGSLRVFQAGRVAFAEILRRIEQAERSVEVRAFLWRDDHAGNRLGQALLAAADRGVAVRIRKDRIAAVYEYTGGNKQSFFHKRPSTMHRFQAWFLGAVSRAPGSFRQRPSALAEALLRHPNIDVSHQLDRFDHSKLFVFDERIVTLGSMNIGDNHHSDWVDVMVEVEGREHVERLRARLDGARFDPGRAIDFLVHSRAREPRGSCPMLIDRLALIEAAERSLTVEMAYLGDGRFTAALLRAVRRGVQVKLVTAAKADVLGNLNRATCDTLLARTGAPANLTIVFLPRMVHSKIVVADGHVCDVGSANFTPLSHGVYDEINLHAVSQRFGRALEDAVDQHCAEGEAVQGRIGYRRLHSQIERAIVAYQARRGGRLRDTSRRPILPASSGAAAARDGAAPAGEPSSATPARPGRRLRLLRGRRRAR